MKTSKVMISIFMCILIAVFAITSVINTGILRVATVSASETLVSDVVGVTHVDGLYYHNSTTHFLDEGADVIETDVGTSVIKIWFNKFNYASVYPWNSNWSQFTVNSLEDLAKTSYYQDVLTRSQFKTIILEASPILIGDWKDGLSQTEYNTVYNEIYNATKYFRNNSNFSGKTFILQNWESDNAIKAWNMSSYQQDIAFQGLIDYMDCKQNAIDDAKDDTPTSNVNVYGALEVNKVPEYETYNFPTVIDNVAPYTNMDLYSYSDWDTKQIGDEWKMTGKLDYIAQKAPDSTAFGSKNVFLGEFGSREAMFMSSSTHDAESDRKQREVLARQLQLALRWGVQYAVYWEVYCNELRDGETVDPGEEATESQLRGLWLIRPDGSETSLLNYMAESMSETLSSYKNVCEAESQTISVSSGDSETDIYDTTLTGGYGSKLCADATNDYAEYTIYVPQAGTYGVYVGYKTDTNLGKFQLKVEGENQGLEKDCYSLTSAVTSYDAGSKTFSTAGNKKFKFEVTGKNASSSDYDLIIDYIKLVPVTLATPTPTVTPTVSPTSTPTMSGIKITDYLDNWDNIYSKTSNWNFGTNNAALYFEGDASRAKRTVTTAESIVYNLSNISNFEAKIFYYNNISGKVDIYTSPDNSTWTFLSTTYDTPLNTYENWYRTYFRPSGTIPSGTDYLKIEFDDDAQAWTPQLSEISIANDATPTPGGSTATPTPTPTPGATDTPTLTPTDTPTPGPTATPGSGAIFSDDFESQFSGWTTGSTVNWNSSEPKNGTYTEVKSELENESNMEL